MCTRFIQCHVSPELTRTLFSYVGRAKAMVESVGAPLCACRPARVKKVYYTIDILDDALSHEYTFTGRSFNGPRAESLPAPPRTSQPHKRPRRLSRQSCAEGAGFPFQRWRTVGADCANTSPRSCWRAPTPLPGAVGALRQHLFWRFNTPVSPSKVDDWLYFNVRITSLELILLA